MPTLTKKQKSRALKTARKWVAIKLKLESPFNRELRSYFNEQSSRVRFGLPVETIESILEKQYKRIVNKLTGLKLKQDDRELEDRILLLLFGRASLQADRIDRTTDKFLTRSIDAANKTIIDSGGVITTRELNIITSRILYNYNKNRIGSISTFETQALTEKIRNELTDIASEMMNTAIFEENQALAQEAADLADSATYEQISEDIGRIPAGDLFLAANLLTKTWVTMGDRKVRPTHNKANFQTVPEGEPFIVGGFLLMFPGDSSLGAPLRETSNCRCSKVNL